MITGDSERAYTAEKIQAIMRTTQDRYEPFLGGSAFNAITMMVQLEREHLHLAAAGVSTDSAYGASETHRDRLARLRIEDLTYHSLGQPGICIVETSEVGRKLRIAPRANLEISRYLQKPELLRSVAGADILHLTSFFENPGTPGSSSVASSVAAFMVRLRALNPGLIFSFDPGDNWIRRRHTDALRYLFGQADLLFVNAQEFNQLTRSISQSAPGSSLRRLFPNHTAIIVKQRNHIFIRLSNGVDVVRVRQPTTKSVVDPTGAGDAVCAGVLTAVAERRSLAEGCALGMRIAAARISDYGDRGQANLLGKLERLWTD